ncbi:MAG: glycoside hydrolase family 31 protein [Acidobacteria bacterium]|nr:glycoside hydrolase family 31 protein [Acidobacteriota bacterium]
MMIRGRWLMITVLATALLCAPGALAGWQHAGSVTAVKPLPNGVELQAGKARVQVLAVAASVVRVRLAPDGVFPPDFSWAVLPGAASASVRVRLDDTKLAVELVTARLRVRIRKSPLLIEFLDAAGHSLSQDDPRRPMAWDGTGVRVWKNMPADENYYGLGDKAGSFNRRNQSFTLWNTDAFGWQESTDPLYKSIPFFLALRRGVSYGIFFDNTYRSSFDFGKESGDAYSFGAEGGELNYYFIQGPHPKQVIEEFTALTGRVAMAPLWALGYQQCRYSYYPEARVREIARLFREKKIPADVIYLDIDYQKDNTPFTIDRERFPNFEGMIKDLDAMGFKIIAITDLHIAKKTGYAPYDTGMAGDHFVKDSAGSVFVGRVWPGDSVFPEFTLARTREWWGGLYKDFVNIGLKGFWNDMNEPALFERADKTMPLDTVHRMDDGTSKDHRAIHNVFGMLNARATYEGLRRLRPDERPFVLTRAAYAGAQRYAASWTGDNSSTWNHLRLTVPTLLSLGLSGYANVGVDIGGFAGSPPPDLLTRWMQLGALNPIFRNHTMKGSFDQESWVHGPEHEAIRRRAIELRYRLMPYIYTIFEETTRTGLPMMRPLFLEYPGETNLYDNDQEFLFGRDILVAPVLSEKLDPIEVNLPKGQWYDYWTGARVPGGKPLNVAPLLSDLPLYVRAGAIIPQQPVVQHTDETPEGPLELRVYPGADCRGSLYADDGKTYAYTRGEYYRVDFTCRLAADSLSITISAPQGSYAPWWKSLRLDVFGIEKAPREVRVGAAIVTGWSYDAARKNVTLTWPDPRQAWEIRVSY